MRPNAIPSMLALLFVTSTASAAGKPDGVACGAPEECASTFCVDGVCCASACPSVPSACAGGYMSTASSCATGACKAPETIACAPYACGESQCKTSCTTDADCAAGARCQGGECKAATSACSADRASSIAADGTSVSCAPYLCDVMSGTCRTTCATDADCTDGDVCRSDAGTCAPPDASSPASSDGCTVGSPGAPGAGLVAALAALGAIGAARRRSPRDA